ncbi:MAG: S-methyl-5-thioribose-1-phosphate isomerase [Candidatus Bipolaricaulota bacterium]|nr:S-methyl-5-thioribose-1-phosphate isomerase [Candidatus Bipolaricaulota bacterium]
MMKKESILDFNGIFVPVVYRERGIDLLDQTRLPGNTVVLRITGVDQVAEAIKTMRVRGAPAIGITAAYGMVLGLERGKEMNQVAKTLRATRPTAVNLTWAIDRMLLAFQKHKNEAPEDLRVAMLAEARLIHSENIEANRRIGEAGAELLPDKARVITICNTGALATGGYGTAYGVLRAAHEQGKIEMAYPCETRPRLQGAHLTAWELSRDEIPFRLIVDGAAGALMAHGGIDAVLAGADRIAANGDSANKIGTYQLAILAHYHEVPFYIVAPTSTIDPDRPDGRGITIEERSEDEVLAPRGVRLAPDGARAWNPAFDVTPAKLIVGIITERGVHQSPYHLPEKE